MDLNKLQLVKFTGTQQRSVLVSQQTGGFRLDCAFEVPDYGTPAPQNSKNQKLAIAAIKCTQQTQKIKRFDYYLAKNG